MIPTCPTEEPPCICPARHGYPLRTMLRRAGGQVILLRLPPPGQTCPPSRLRSGSGDVLAYGPSYRPVVGRPLERLYPHYSRSAERGKPPEPRIAAGRAAEKRRTPNTARKRIRAPPCDRTNPCFTCAYVI